MDEEFRVTLEQINEALNSALRDISDDLIQEMHEEAERVVYGYTATPEAMATRRGTIADRDNFDVEYGDLYVRITNTAEMQGTDDGVTEGDFVQLGLYSYRQPYARDFMRNALVRYVESGRVDDAIRSALQQRGIDTSTYVGGGHQMTETLASHYGIGIQHLGE